MNALIEALDRADRFESLAAYSAAFELAALSSPTAGDASLHGDGDVVKKTIVTAIPPWPLLIVFEV